MNRLYALITSTLLLLSTPLHADSTAELRSRLDAMTSLQGEFTQVLIDMDGEVLEESSGDFAMARPGKFDWHTREPFEQRLVSDHESIWLYDPDLMQVTVREFDEELQDTPALILSDELTALNEQFEITDTVTDEGWDAFRLEPKDDDSLFAALVLTFDGNLLREIRMDDNLDQITRFTLSDLKRNESIDDGRFTFEVPDGVDVLVD
ncbi:outer membrane lipoprotein carrier protein [Marinimicrobium koreense]|uniref:Outer-membrane lipoprotein carrier protein n=1 Tax=Marinimicrobium koreense TaxID=306545 RepID=A0A3N1NYI2_9GAMM|nr:outer membrane lipoprotein chaperone LolA [Marinimicrobium koreense]ROQ20451.1 outer membrane lipoprotein carrier protein [Marinimicrobium koreense]